MESGAGEAPVIFLTLTGCMVIAGFFAGLETGLLTANRMLIQEKQKMGDLAARAAEFIVSKPERLLSVTLVGYNIANVTAAVLLTNYLEHHGLENVTWAGILVMTLVFLVLDDLVPKSFFRRFADTFSVRLSPLLLVFYYLFLPLNLVLNLLIKSVLLLTGQHRSRREELKSKRDLRFLVNLTGKGVGLPPLDQRIIEDIFDFRDQLVREVMIPFHQLPVVGVRQSLDDAVQLASASGSRFLPVSETRTDNVIGLLDTKALFWSSGATIRDVMQRCVFYPETRRLPELLLEMNRRGLEVVLLSDEFGGVAGMITPGQIVGDLFHFNPEEGSAEEKIEILEPGRYRVCGTTDLDDLSHEVGITLRQGYNSTVGGLLCERLGMIPPAGHVFEEAGFRFEVTEADERHVIRVEITLKSSPGGAGI